MSNNRTAGDAEHQEVCSLIPWYVNSRLSDHERIKVEAHILDCEACRADIAMEQRIFDAIKGVPTIEYMPAASLKRLQAKLDGLQSRTAATDAAPLQVRRAWPKRGLAASSSAFMPWPIISEYAISGGK